MMKYYEKKDDERQKILKNNFVGVNFEQKKNKIFVANWLILAVFF